MPMDLDQPYGHQHDLMDSETMKEHAVDMQLAMQILQSVDLPPTCVNWDDDATGSRLWFFASSLSA